MRSLLLFFALLAASAHASALDDVALGGDVQLQSVVLRVDGHAFALNDRVVSKAPGSLDVWVPLTAFGLAHGDVVRLSGTQSGSQLRWSFDHRLSSDYVQGTVHVQRVRGTLVLEASRIPSRTPCGGSACARNVRLRLAPGSSVEASGWNVIEGLGNFTKGVEVATFTASAGVAQPVLQSLTVDLPRSRCASPVWTTLTGVVTLSGPAASDGATVALRSTDPSAVWVPAVRVRAGERSARFTGLLRAGFSSTAQVTAVAGGVSRMALVDRVNCPVLTLPPSIARLLALPGRPLGLTTDGQVVVQRATGDVLVDVTNGKETSLSSLLGVSDARVSAVKGRELTLRPSANATETWLVNLLGPRSGKLPLVTPVALTPAGLSLAYDAQGNLGLLDAHAGFQKPKALEKLSVSSASGNAAGNFAVGLVDGNDVVPAVLNFEQVTRLGAQPGEAVAILESGEVFGHQLDGQKNHRAFSCDAACVADGGKFPKVYALPRGCASATVTLASESGWISGLATCSGKSLPWISGPTRQVWRLDELFKVPNAELREVVAISDDGELLVRAASSQTNSYFWVKR